MNEPWISRWQEGRIGWHEPAGNANLKRFWQWRGCRVLVPLCGKSVDLAWLEQHDNEVVGVELSAIAARAFFEENDIRYRVSRGGDRFVASGRRITVVCGDYFEFGENGFDAHYDRGALIALPAAIRPRYAAHTGSLLGADARQLVVTLEYDQSQVQGPPFSVPPAELLGYWPQLECVAARDDIDNAPPKFRDAGLARMFEVVWRTPADPRAEATR